MMMKHLLASLTLVLALGACKKGGGNGGGSGGSSSGASVGSSSGGSSDVDAFIALDSDKAVAFAVGGTDCEAKAKSVGDWRKAHTAQYKALQNKLKEQWPKGPPEDVIAKYGEKMQANKKAVVDAMLACSNNEAFGKMMDETKTE